MSRYLGDHAIVIGGSIAGLIAARVLSDYFDRVTVLERDRIDDRPALRKSVPQGDHAHGLMLGGARVLSRLYPGFVDKLLNLGAVSLRVGEEFAILTPNGKAYSFGGAVREPRDIGFRLYQHSRALLEHCIRCCTLESNNIAFQSDSIVQGLVYRDGEVRGVKLGNGYSLEGDLAIDAGGRGSHSPRWLRDLGFAAPEETTIGVDFAYSSARFLVRNHSEPERSFYAFGPGPHYPKAGFLAENEEKVWILSLGGRFGDYPPTDEQGLLAFAKSLHTPKLYELVKSAERVSEISHYRFPLSLRRHYERLDRFPERYLVLGDAIASFNPIYAQGMTSAALQAEALQRILETRVPNGDGMKGLPKGFFAKAAEVVSVPWMMAAQSDFAYPQTKGERPPADSDSGRYIMAAEALSAEDPGLQALIWEVFSLAKPLATLLEEPLHSRVLMKMKELAT